MQITLAGETNVWAFPKVSPPPLATLPDGIEVVALTASDAGGWVKIACPDNKQGWIYLEPPPKPINELDVLSNEDASEQLANLDMAINQTETRQTWSYAVLSVVWEGNEMIATFSGENYPSINSALAEAGRRGWELVGVHQTHLDGSTFAKNNSETEYNLRGFTLYILKRPLVQGTVSSMGKPSYVPTP